MRLSCCSFLPDMSNTTTAIILARGGSKGIPRKNIRPLCGKPLIVWNIEAALAAETIQQVIVSTDDEEIATVAEAAGAFVVDRPVALAGDSASSEAGLLHVLDTLEQRGEALPAIVAFLQCTSPLTTPDDIDGVVALVAEEGYDSAVTGVAFHYFVWKQDETGSFVGVNHDETRRLMRQDRAAEYLEVGAVYAFRMEGFRKHAFRFFGRIGMYPIEASRAIEIDVPDDWVRAEMMLRHLHPESVPRRPVPDSVAVISDLDLSGIKAVVTDFDGVLTDNLVQLDAGGNETVRCNRSDGWGIQRLREAGYKVACISTEKNDIVARRCEKLKIPYVHGEDDKKGALTRMSADWGISASQILYVGNETNDAECLALAGVGVVPSDAVLSVVKYAKAKTLTRGGEGVLREIAAALLGG